MKFPGVDIGEKHHPLPLLALDHRIRSVPANQPNLQLLRESIGQRIPPLHGADTHDIAWLGTNDSFHAVILGPKVGQIRSVPDGLRNHSGSVTRTTRRESRRNSAEPLCPLNSATNMTSLVPLTRN